MNPEINKFHLCSVINYSPGATVGTDRVLDRGRLHGELMSLVNEVGEGLDGLGQLRALLASGRKPGILVSLGLEFVEVDSGRAVFAGVPGEHAYNPIGSVH